MNGGQIRTVMIIKGDPAAQTGSGERMRLTIAALRELGEVDIIAIAARLRSDTLDGLSIKHVPIVHRATRIRNLVGAVVSSTPRRLVAGRPRQQARLVADALTPPYDLVWAYTDRAALAVPRTLSGTPLVTDLIDYEGDRDVSLARNASWRLRHVRLIAAFWERAALRRTIRKIHRRSTITVVSSPADIESLQLAEVAMMPNGYRAVGPPLGRGRIDGSALSVMFVGFLMYPPNVEALEWLLSDIWPVVHRAMPDARLRVVGRGMERRSWPEAPAVDMVGEVPTMDGELARADVLVVPLKSGSGTRIKILEAWANRIPVVTTLKGCEGLGAIDGESVLVAETAAEFAAALQRLIHDEGLAARLTTHGYRRYTEEFSADAVTAVAKEIAERCVRG